MFQHSNITVLAGGSARATAAGGAISPSRPRRSDEPGEILVFVSEVAGVPWRKRLASWPGDGGEAA